VASTCHDPHSFLARTKSSPIPPECLTCHQPHVDGSGGPDCISCHMPRQPVRTGPWSPYGSQHSRKPWQMKRARHGLSGRFLGRLQGVRELGLPTPKRAANSDRRQQEERSAFCRGSSRWRKHRGLLATQRRLARAAQALRVGYRQNPNFGCADGESGRPFTGTLATMRERFS